MTELDDRVAALRDRDRGAARPTPTLKIAYMTAPAAGALSIFEVSALVRSLQTLVTGARPLRATDAMLGDRRPAGPERGACSPTARASPARPATSTR